MSESTPRGTTESAPGIVVEQRGDVHVVSLNRPERRNSLDLPDRIALIAALRACDEDPSCRAVVLRGEGRVFCAGGDLSTMAAGDGARERLRLAADLIETVIRLRKPVVAAVQGAAAGLGLALAASTDYVVSAHDAVFFAPFGAVGLAPDSAATWVLPRRIGYGRAAEMLIWGERVDASTALGWGLINAIAPGEELLDVALDRAQRVSLVAPDSVAAVKELIRLGSEETLRLRADREVETQERLFGTANFAEGRAAFYEKRPPRFRIE